MRKLYSFIIAACVAMSFPSCEDHVPERILDSTKNVGNILLSNGSIVSPENAGKAAYNAIGVIYHTSGDTAYVVSVRECGLSSFSDDSVSVQGISKSTTDMMGFENTVAIMASSITSDAVNRVTGIESPAFYVPSAGELRALARNIATVERSMAAVHGDPFDNAPYLSSTEDGSSQSSSRFFCYCVNVYNGYVSSTAKSSLHNLRAFSKFK